MSDCSRRSAILDQVNEGQPGYYSAEAGGERRADDDGRDANGGELVADVASGGRVGCDGFAAFDGDEVEPVGAGVGDELGETRALQDGGGAEVGVGGDVGPAVSAHEWVCSSDVAPLVAVMLV